MKSRIKTGFTLVEVMVCIVVMGIIGLVVYKLISNARLTSAIAECRGVLRQNVQLSAKQLQKDIASSKAILDPTDTTKKKYKMSLELGSPDGGIVLTMKAPILSDDGSLKKDETVTYFDGDTQKEDDLFEKVTYELNDGILKRVGEKSGTFKLGTNIKSVKFAKNAIDGIDVSYDGKIEVTILAEAKPAGQNKEIKYEEQIIVSIRALQNKNLKEEDDNKFKRRIGKDDY